MNVKYLVAASVAAVVSVSSAQAQSFQGFSWTGLVLGVQGGASTALLAKNSISKEDNALTQHDQNSKENLTISNIVGGVFAGYNIDTNHGLVISSDVDLILYGKKGTKGIEGIIKGVQENWSGSSRIGFGVSIDRMMPYVAGGIVFGSFKMKEDDNNGVPDTGEYRPEAETSKLLSRADEDKPEDVKKSANNMKIGYTLGGGVAFAATESLILRVEYRNSNFGKIKFENIKDVADIYEKSLKTNDVRFGIAYKF